MFNYEEKIVLTILFFLLVAIYVMESKKTVNFVYVNKLQKIAPFFILIGFTVYNIWITGKLNVQDLYLDKPIFVTWLIICVMTTFYILYKKQVLPDYYKNEKLKESVRKAFIALIIYYFARLDLVFSPFLFVFVFYYFF